MSNYGGRKPARSVFHICLKVMDINGLCHTDEA
jgi:hypothetical protein